jgi:hypothetical protein
VDASPTGSRVTEPMDVPLTPYRKPLRTWAGHGTGAVCDRCHEPIQPHEIEYEIELGGEDGSTARSRALPNQGTADWHSAMSLAGSEARSLRFHFSCYRNWAGR